METPPFGHGEVVLLQFDEVYEQHVDYLWRAARGMGVPEGTIEDVLQEVFVVVHRRLAEFEGRSTVRTWLTRILLHVVSEHRRRFRRKEGKHAEFDDDAAPSESSDPGSSLDRRRALAVLQEILEAMPDEQRTVFVLAEIEGVSAPEIAEMTNANVNTVYSRLRLARAEYARHVSKLRTKEVTP